MTHPDFTGERIIISKSPRHLERESTERYRFATKMARHHGRVLDIACGTGHGSKMLSRAEGVRMVVGVDINSATVRHAEEMYGGDGLQFECGSLYSFRHPILFDLIVSFESIEHVDHPVMALKNLYNQLCPGGTIIISTPNRHISSPSMTCPTDKPHNPFHCQEFSLSEIGSRVYRAGFRIEAVYGQRFQVVPRNKFLRKVIRSLLKHKCPVIGPLQENREPKINIIVARKP